MDKLEKLWFSTGVYHIEPGQAVMIAVCLVLLFLAIRKGFEPLLLLPIAVGGLLANIPLAGMAESAVSQALSLGSADLIAQIGALLGVDPAEGSKVLHKAYESSTPTLRAEISELAHGANYADGLLY